MQSRSPWIKTRGGILAKKNRKRRKRETRQNYRFHFCPISVLGGGFGRGASPKKKRNARNMAEISFPFSFHVFQFFSILRIAHALKLAFAPVHKRMAFARPTDAYVGQNPGKKFERGNCNQKNGKRETRRNYRSHFCPIFLHFSHHAHIKTSVCTRTQSQAFA